jgi:hypothetical protein
VEYVCIHFSYDPALNDLYPCLRLEQAKVYAVPLDAYETKREDKSDDWRLKNNKHTQLIQKITRLGQDSV